MKLADACYVGILIQKAMSKLLPPLEYLTNAGYQAIAQMDVCYQSNSIAADISIYPQVDAIETLIAAYPDAYFIHTKRSSISTHVASLAASIGMLDCMKNAGLFSRFEGQIASNSDTDNAEVMVAAMTQLTVNAFSNVPGVKFLSITIEDQDAPSTIAEFLGLDSFTLEHTKSTHSKRKPTSAPTLTALDSSQNDDIVGDDTGDEAGTDGDDVALSAGINTDDAGNSKRSPTKAPLTSRPIRAIKPTKKAVSTPVPSAFPTALSTQIILTPISPTQTPTSSSFTEQKAVTARATATPTASFIFYVSVIVCVLASCGSAMYYRYGAKGVGGQGQAARSYKKVSSDSDTDSDDEQAELNPFIVEMTSLPKAADDDGDDYQYAHGGNGLSTTSGAGKGGLQTRDAWGSNGGFVSEFDPFDLSDLTNVDISDEELFASNAPSPFLTKSRIPLAGVAKAMTVAKAAMEVGGPESRFSTLKRGSANEAARASEYVTLDERDSGQKEDDEDNASV